MSLTRDGRNILSVSFRLEAGDFALLLGPNGSGKTTILDLIAGVRRLDSGRLHIGINTKEAIGYAVQDANSGMLPWKTIVQNIMLPFTLCPDANGSQPCNVLNLLRKFRLFEKQNAYPYQLSGGEKQVTNLIRTILTPGRIVLIDEVLSSLHADLRAFAKQVLRDELKGKTVVMITHDPADIDLPANKYLSIRNQSVIAIDREEAEGVLLNAV